MANQTKTTNIQIPRDLDPELTRILIQIIDRIAELEKKVNG